MNLAIFSRLPRRGGERGREVSKGGKGHFEDFSVNCAITEGEMDASRLLAFTQH